MRRWKSLIYFLLLNIVISAAATLLVLRWWESRGVPAPAPGTAVVIRLTAAPQDTLAAATDSLTVSPDPSASLPAVDALLPTSTIEVITYYVQSGDTLGTIAAAYQVSMADLLVVNSIDDPDQLYIGQPIYIPTGPLPTRAPPPSATPAVTATQTATLQPTTGPLPTASLTTVWQPAGMQIITVIGAGDLANERVVLERTGSGELSLAGWKLEDQDGHIYNFPQLTLYEHGAVNLYTRLGQNTVVELFWGLTAAVWQRGETVTLVDAQGTIHATFAIP